MRRGERTRVNDVDGISGESEVTGATALATLSPGVRAVVTIVTPSFNQGQFLRDAIESVLAQDYPHVEYLVVDGGSTDSTLDVLASYGDRVDWISEPDNGQANAINKGFQRTTGAILGWLNADDAYAPGAISAAVNAFESHPNVGLIYGQGQIMDADGAVVGAFDEIEPFSLWRLLHGLDYILQPAAFFRREATAAVGWLDEDLNFAMDWDLWLKLATTVDVRYVSDQLAFARVHHAAKTSVGGWPRIRELGRVARAHAGTFWTPGVCLYAIDTLARQLKQGSGSWRRVVEGLERRAGARVASRLALHADGWLGPRGKLAVPTRWGQVAVALEAHRLPTAGHMRVAITADGQPLADTAIHTPGPFELRLPLPATDHPFVELDVACDYSFVDAIGRRLAVRCVGLEGC